MTKRRKKPQPRPGTTVRDKYLRKNFEITEEEYNEALRLQGGHCKGCPYVPTNISLHVDHDHAIAGWPVDSEKKGVKYWLAWPRGYYPLNTLTETPMRFSCRSETKPKALALVRRKLLRISVRGLTCWQCNASIKKLRDDKDIATNLSKYLWEYHNFIVGLTDFRNGFKK